MQKNKDFGYNDDGIWSISFVFNHPLGDLVDPNPGV